MLIDVDGLEDKVKPQIKNTRKYLEKGKDSLVSISIPRDFSYRTKLRNISQTILSIDSRINTIDDWINETISNFSNAEANNKGVMESLISAIPLSLMGGEVIETDGNTASILNSNDFVSEIKSAVKGAIDWVFSSEWIINLDEMAKKTDSKVSDEVESVILDTVSTGAEIKENVTNCESTKIESGLEFVGGKLSEAWEFAYQDILKPISNFLNATGASIVNPVIGLVKGIVQLIESLLDLIVMLLVGAGTIVLVVLDIVTYSLSLVIGETDEWNSETASCWKKTMGYVAKDHVGNAFESFYSNNVVGQFLDEEAIGIFKSEGIGTNIASGIGYVAGIVLLALATAGIGTIASGGAVAGGATTGGAAIAGGATAGTAGGAAAVAGGATAEAATTIFSSVIATAAGTGKGIQEFFGKMRDSSWVGIKEMYEKGEVSEDQINTFIVIRNLTDEEWLQIKNDYLAGNISKEEFEQIKQIREMPEDWTTLENGVKGIFYGVGTGVWEGIQWYVGGKLAGWAYEGSKGVASATRVSVDTAFNAMDTPYRTLLDFLSTGNTLEEAWASSGGWQSMLTDIGIGLISSTGGEIYDGIKNAKNLAKGTDQIDDLVDTLPKKLNQVSDLVDVLNTGNFSDQRVVNLIQNSFNDWLGKNNPYAEKLINKLIELKQTYPDLTFEVSPIISNWDLCSRTLYLGDNQINWGDSGTLAHEIGHMLFALVQSEKLPDNWDIIKYKAQDLSSNANNIYLRNTLTNIVDDSNLNKAKATSVYENNIKDAGYKSIDDFIDRWTKNLNATKSNNIINSLRKAGFDEKVIQKLEKELQESNITNMDARKVVVDYVNTQIRIIQEYFDRLTNGGTECAISDIICSVFKGSRRDLNGVLLNYTYSHKAKYYKSESYVFHEIIANFTQLKMSGKTEALKALRDIFGDEFYFVLEEMFNKLIE